MARRKKSLRDAALQMDDPYGYVKNPSRAAAAAKAASSGASGSGVPDNVARTAEGFVIPGVTLDSLGRPTGGPTLPESTGGRVEASASVRSNAQANALLSGEAVAAVKEDGAFDSALKIGSTIKDSGAHWLSSLFDTEDEADLNIAGIPLGGVESTWDGFFKGMGWVYDRINQGGTYGQALLPGGLEPLTWEQSNDISWGQAAVTDVAMRDDQMQGSLLGKIVSKPVNLAAGGLLGGGLGLMANQGDMAPYTRPGFDITNPAQREAAFTKSEVGKWTSGLTDTAIAILADPLILGGKALKVSKVRYLDRLIRTQDDVTRVGQELQYGKTILDRNATTITPTGVAARTVEDITREEAGNLAMAPIARFAHDVVERVALPDGTFVKRLSDTEIYNHRVIRTSTNRDALTAALYNARTYDEASMVLRHAAGDLRASAEMMELAPHLYREVLDGERRLVTEMVRTDPTMVAAEMAKWEARHDVLIKRLEDMKKVGVDEAAIARVREEADDVALMWRDAANAQFNPVGTGPVASADEIALMRRSIDKELEGNELFYSSLADARGGSGLFNAFGKSTSGFTKGRIDDATTLTSKMSDEIGKIIHESRARRATKTSKAQMGRGFVEDVQGGWVAQTFYGINKRNPVARVLRWSAVERPSGLVYTSGVGAQESAREIRGLMNSIDIYSGTGRIVQRDGKDVLIGGVQNKERAIQAYQNAMLRGGDEAQFEAKKVLDDLEQQLLDDIADWHGLDRDLLNRVHYHQNRQLEKVAKDIIDEGYWTEAGETTRNYAPYLETQLLTQRFMKNWRKIDHIAGRVAKHERRRRGIVVDSETARYTDSGLLANTANNFNRLNSAFQDFWRPAVLLRLGYTQRNVMEGMFRSMAFQWSLAPVGYAAQNLGYGFSNIARKRGMTGAIRQAEQARAGAKAGLSMDQMPPKFQKWRNSQLEAIRGEVGNTQEAVVFSRGVLARENAEYRALRIEKLEAENTRILDFNANARAQGPMSRETANAVKHNEDRLIRIYDELSDIKPLTGGAPVLDDTARAMIDNLDYLDDVQQPFNLMVWDALDDPLQASNMFRRNTLQHRRVFGKTKSASDRQTMQAIMSGKAFDEAFDPTSSYAQIALSNLSADHTMRATAAMRMQAVTDALNLQETRYFVDVNPGDPQYFDGVATVLNQFQNSDIGQIVIKGRATGRTNEQIGDEVAKFLYSSKQGDVVGRFIAAVNDYTFGGRFEGVNVRVARGQKEALEAAEPLDIAKTQSRQFRTQVTREVRQAERDLAKRQAATNRTLTRFKWHDGSYKTRAQLDKMIADADEGVKVATKEYDDFVRAFPEPEPKDLGRYDLTELEDAREYVYEVLRRYDIVTAKSQSLQEYLYANRQLPIGRDFKDTTSGDIVKSFLTDATGKDLPDLQPVVGHLASMVGEKTWMDMFRATTAVGFKILGTIPEDAMVRAPMYGKRYLEAVKDSYGKVVAQVGEDGLTMRHVNMIREQAHRRALKDTKDWLYTIDRRTNLGAVMENWIPFVSATQNSITTVGRIVWNDPAVLGVMRLVWQAPDKMFDDGDGNPDTFAYPIAWMDNVPGLSQLKSALRLDDYLQQNKRSYDLLFNGIMDPQFNGLIKLPSSEAMKNGLFGLYTPDAPDWLRALDVSEGEGTAEWVWDRWKALNFGEGFGASQVPGSVDLLMSGWQRNALDAVLTESLGTASIARSFNMIRMQENLKYQAGLRSDEPGYEEVVEQTRAFAVARFLGSIGFAFQPQYENNVEVAAEAVYKIDTANRAYRNEYDSLVAQGKQAEADALPVVAPAEAVFGPEVVEALGIRSRTNKAGAPSSAAAVDRARENAALIRKLAPDLESSGNLDTLGLLFTDVDDLYDPNAQAWMVSNTVPGTDETFRGVDNPEQSYRDARIAAGWQRWMRGKEALELDMANKGVSWASMGEREEFLYTQQKNQLRDGISETYPEWRTVFDDQGGLRASSAVKTIEAALSDPVWQEKHKDDAVWQQGGIANQYVVSRQQYIDARRGLMDDMKSKGMFSRQAKQATLYDEGFKQLDEWWKGQQAIFRATSPTWVGIQDRWIGEDEQPTPAGGYGMDEEAA